MYVTNVVVILAQSVENANQHNPTVLVAAAVGNLLHIEWMGPHWQQVKQNIPEQIFLVPRWDI